MYHRVNFCTNASGSEKATGFMTLSEKSTREQYDHRKTIWGLGGKLSFPFSPPAVVAASLGLSVRFGLDVWPVSVCTWASFPLWVTVCWDSPRLPVPASQSSCHFLGASPTLPLLSYLHLFSVLVSLPSPLYLSASLSISVFGICCDQAWISASSS